MSFRGLLVHDVVIVNPRLGTDRYGNEVKNWFAATRTPAKAWVAQRTASEIRDGREALVGSWTIMLAPDTDISGRSRVEWDGRTFEVDGEPRPAHTRRGPHHLEATLRLVEG
jgi:head-tail adaptor